MGRVPQHLWQQLQNILEKQPHLVTWSPPADVIVRRGPAGRLGFKIHTFQDKEETFTVITKVKEECVLETGSLWNFDRIVAVNNYKTTRDSNAQVLSLLTSVRGAHICLTICQPRSYKIPTATGYDEVPCRLKVDSGKNTKQTSNHSPSSGQKKIKQSITGTCNSSVRSLQDNADEINGNIHVTLSQKHLGFSVLNQLSPSDGKSSVDGKKSSGYSSQRVIHDLSPVGPRTSNDSSADSVDISGTGLTIVYKRGFSQVSASSSNQSASSQSPESQMRRVQVGKSKGDNKGAKKLGNLAVSVSQDELEPLHPTGSVSPLPLSLGGLHSSLHTEQSTLSMPLRNDPAVSMQDIVVFEEGPYSLPMTQTVGVSGGAVRGSSCPCPTCTVTSSDQKVCGHCGNSSVVSTQKLPNPDVTLVLDSSNEQLPEDYCNLLLQKPHLAVWDGRNTHVVELDKKGHTEFGFKYKVKIVKNEDTVDIYTLVESVVKNGPAKDKLRVGDWIRSVNGTPIQIPQDAFTLISNNAGSLLRLVVQRPVGFSQKPPGVHGDKPDKYIADNQPYSSSPQPSSREQDPLMTTMAPIPGIIEPAKGPEKPVQPMNIYISQEATINECDISNLPFPKTVKLPKVRIFICGGEAEKCASSILRQTDIELKAQGPGYSYCFCSMATDCFGNVVTSAPCANLYATSSQLHSYVASAAPTSPKEVGDTLRCKSCSSDALSPSSQNALGTVVNIEFFVISDDSFFHSCSNYLFTKSSIFILTFDGGKLLRSSACEFSRLQNLSHTIRSFAGDECHIMSCGLLDCDNQTRNMADEVRALFYTPFNTQLQTFNVSGPELVTMTPVSPGDTVVDTKQLQTLLWKVVTETIQRQRVLHPSLLLSDHFHSQRSGDMFISEGQLMDVIRSKLPMYGVDVHQVVLTYLIMNGEIILGKATPFNNPKVHKIEPLVILEPKLLLDTLYQIISTISEDKQTWARTVSTGFLSASRLLSLCGQAETHAQYLVDFMESFGLVFCKCETFGGGGRDYFLPYFCTTPSAPKEAVTMERKDYLLYLQFNEHTSTQTFLHLMFFLGGLSDSPTSLSIQMGQSCSFHYKGIYITAIQEKVEDRVKFIIRREDKTSGIKPHELYLWLFTSCRQMLDSHEKHFLLGAPCPLGDKCSRGSSSGLHIVDMRETRAQYCGQVRIDLQKPVSLWRQKDIEVPLTVSPQPQKQINSILDLNYTIFHRICLKLSVPSDLGRDWKGLAGQMGYTSEKVSVFEVMKEPVQQFLREWSHTCKNSMEELIKHLETLERDDILFDIRQSLGQNALSPLKEESVTSTISNIALNSREEHEVRGQGQTRKINNLELVDLDSKGQGAMSSTPVQVLTQSNPLTEV